MLLSAGSGKATEDFEAADRLSGLKVAGCLLRGGLLAQERLNKTILRLGADQRHSVGTSECCQVVWAAS